MQRNKTLAYDEDDLYPSDEDNYGEEEETEYTEEDKSNFATLTPVVRAEVEEAGLQASDREIEDALWNYYWDVAKSVAYLKNAKQPKKGLEAGTSSGSTVTGKKEKAGSRFEEAAARSNAATAGTGELIEVFPSLERWQLPVKEVCSGGSISSERDCTEDIAKMENERRETRHMRSPSSSSWFSGIAWTNVPSHLQAHLVPAYPCSQRPRLLGGSSKLAKLAEERRRKAAAGSATTIQESPNGSFSSLDRLSKPKDAKENAVPEPKVEPKKYPMRRKRDPTPPPREPTPEPEEVKDEGPDLRAAPSSFGRALAAGEAQASGPAEMMLKDLTGDEGAEDPFSGPSPDDAVLRAQRHSKGLAK